MNDLCLTCGHEKEEHIAYDRKPFLGSCNAYLNPKERIFCSCTHFVPKTENQNEICECGKRKKEHYGLKGKLYCENLDWYDENSKKFTPQKDVVGSNPTPKGNHTEPEEKILKKGYSVITSGSSQIQDEILKEWQIENSFTKDYLELIKPITEKDLRDLINLAQSSYKKYVMEKINDEICNINFIIYELEAIRDIWLIKLPKEDFKECSVHSAIKSQELRLKELEKLKQELEK